MAHRKRHVVECVWSGYCPSQSRPCHRTVETAPRKIAALKQVSAIQFTDGTTMSVDIRECAPREKVAEIKGYNDLLNEIVAKERTGFVTVASLQENP